MIDISLIYVNYFSCDEISRSILSFRKSLSKLKYEIIIVDNSNNQKEFEHLKEKCSFKYTHFLRMKKNYGFGEGCNRGAKIAKGEYLFLLNPDTRYYKGKIESLLSFYKKTDRCGIVAPLLLNIDFSLQYSARRFPTLLNQLFGRNSFLTKINNNNALSSKYMYMKADYSSPLKVDWVRAAAIVINRKLFLEIKGFSPEFFMFVEDVDLCRKLSEKKFSIYINPDLSIIHKLGITVKRQPIRKIWMHNKSLYIYFSKRYKILNIILFFTVIMRIILISINERIK